MTRAFVCMIVLAVGMRTASANEGVGVVVTGDATIQPQLAALVEDWLRQRGHQLVAAPLRPDALAQLLDCFVIEDNECARKVVSTQAVTSAVVFVRADYVESSAPGPRDLQITAYWFDRDAAPVAVRRLCSACGDAQLKLDVDKLMVSIGGKDLKPAPLPVALPPPPPTETRNLVPFGVAGAGFALLVTGLVMVGMDEDDTGESYEYRDTAAAGVTLSVIGVAAIGVGGYLFARDRKRESRPTVAVTPHGAYVGWSRSF